MLVIALSGCAGGGAAAPPDAPTPSPSPEPGVEPSPGSPPTADIVGVSASGDPGTYTFAVSVRSDETGCDQYADWWEVVSEDGELVYRRILQHSHPTEQPFERTGGPVAVDADTTVWVRAHLAPGGYVGDAMVGSVADGFAVGEPVDGFAADLETTEPLPTDCAF